MPTAAHTIVDTISDHEDAIKRDKTAFTAAVTITKTASRKLCFKLGISIAMNIAYIETLKLVVKTAGIRSDANAPITVPNCHDK